MRPRDVSPLEPGPDAQDLTWRDSVARGDQAGIRAAQRIEFLHRFGREANSLTPATTAIAEVLALRRRHQVRRL